MSNEIENSGQTKPETTPEEEEKRKERIKFWSLFCAWTVCALIIPVAFIVWRYQLFQPTTVMQFGGWGVVATVIVAVFAVTCFKYVDRGLVGWSMAKQIIKGLCAVTVPLLAVFFCLKSIANNIDLFLQSMLVVIASETAAIPLNPLPKWVADKRGGAYEGAVDYFFRRYDERQSEKGGK